ncbi:MAG: (4Fe-4S)-binding protein [Flavobacteriales bacterium]|jgi:uncharacterized Fe-S cluster protein YjdI|nr:(4Fe-4S)-binding protein [Flavobacteriales bacterium]
MSKEHTYSNGEVTIIWKPHLCIHSTKCWKGLPAVFRPAERPWVEPGGATTEAIVAQVRECPSGALTHRMERPAPPAPEVAAEAAPVVEVAQNGPLLLRSDCTVRLPDGTLERRTGVTALCRCGHSARKPYCDGSHRKVGFVG